MGPKAKFAYTTFQIKDVFINTKSMYEILLENVGDIPTGFNLRSVDFFDSTNYELN